MKLRDALELGRVSNLPTVWSNVLAGIVLAQAPVSLGVVVWALVAFSLAYVGGMYLNDAFDREIDARERPDRPIPAGRVRAATVFAVGFSLLGASMGALAMAAYVAPYGTGWRALAGGGGLAVAIVAYDAWHKSNPFAPVVMGLCRFMVYVAAAAAVRPNIPGELWVGAAMLLLYVLGLTHAARREAWNRVGSLWPMLFLIAPLLAIATDFAGDPWLAGPAAALLGWLFWSLSFLWRSKRDVGGAVSRLIAGISLVDTVAMAAAGAWWPAAAAAACVPLTRLFQRFVPGT
ncbi:MAG: UbiA family prenyltransferase [Myxococcales bacterium]|nr:UbiA family prenyltransferase [Myxococcales bacterium]